MNDTNQKQLVGIPWKIADELVDQGLLEVSNPDAGRNVRKYRRPSVDVEDFFSNLLGKEPGDST